MTPDRRANLDRLFKPRHIAFVGGRDAEVAIKEAERRGFPGHIWAVNPKRDTLGGHACLRGLADLPDAPDAVFLAVPAPAAVEAVRELAAIGAGGVVCYTAGFREAGDGGAELERQLIEAAGEMALVGPNCYGIINYLDRVALWPFAHGGTSPGWGAAIITQSGMLSSDITMAQRSLPLTHMISGGNQSVLTIEDFVDYLADQAAVRAIGVHIEGLRDVRAFERAALKALENSKPVVALKTGTSQIGAALAVSHTGSLSGMDDLYDALFARTGVIRVKTPSELLETLKFICAAGIPAGNRVMGFTCSGGGAAMLADHGETIGLAFPPFDDRATAELARLLPDIATVSNPLDYTTPIWGDPARTEPVFQQAIHLSQANATILVQDYPAAGLDEALGFYLADAGAFTRAATGIPAAICATLPENMDQATRDRFVAAGIAPMQGIAETVTAMGAAIRWGTARDRITAARPQPLLPGRSMTPGRSLTEAEGKALLARLGLPVPPGRVVAGSDVAQAAAAVGYPVALKMMGPRLLHKTEAGAVATGLGDADALAQARDRMVASVRAHDPEAVTNRFLVECMAPPPLAELIVSIRRDPQFGLAMTLGSGGILVELVGDAETLLLPATTEDIADALGRLKVAKLLAGFRARASVDLGGVAAVLAVFAAKAAARAEDFTEIEINPLLVCVDGLWAVDALVTTGAP
ncbi:MAG: acetate--CoA ligase family protein [Rhodobacteraceae bacterium]|nr:acetate--CoA ligase family protein [Paracoccaceae bacterium]